jgi:hypothetical protein
MAARAVQTTYQRVFRAIVLRLSRLGERTGLEWLTYNPGVYWHFHWIGQHDAPVMADAVCSEFPDARSIADIGCGTGVFAAAFKRKGLRVGACEYAAAGRRWARSQGIDAVPFDVATPGVRVPGGPFDLAMSLEVAEHIPPHLADAFVDLIARTADRIVMTAARPGQGGQGHINEQPQSYWVAKFQSRGFRHDAEASGRISRALQEGDASDFLYLNMMVFRKS